MSDKPSRVRVVLPGGRIVPGRLLGRGQGEDGAHWAEVTIRVPSRAVREERYLIATDTRGIIPVEVHTERCWLISQTVPWRRLEPATAAAARAAIDARTQRCQICTPDP